jgi:hypothetical protein
MKHRIYGLIYLSILIFYILRPVLPFIEYSILKEYIVKNLCINRDNPETKCDGKCFLHDQLKKSGDPVDADKDNGKKTIQRVNIEDHLKTNEIVTSPFQIKYKLVSFFNPGTPGSYSTPIFIPPKF